MRNKYNLYLPLTRKQARDLLKVLEATTQVPFSITTMAHRLRTVLLGEAAAEAGLPRRSRI